MKVLIVNEDKLEKISKHYYAVDSWIRFPKQLASHCEQVTLLSGISVHKEGTSPPPETWCVEPGNLRIEHHDYYDSFSQYYRLLPKRFLSWRRKAARLIENHDIVVLRVPSPIISLITRCASRKNKPLILIISGNLQTSSDRVRSSRGIKRWLYSALLKFLVFQEERCAKHAAIVYAYGDEIARRFESINDDVRLMRTLHLSLDDFVYRDDTCQSDEIRLLRVCRLSPIKGIEPLMEAIVLLAGKGLPVRLEIVGSELLPGYQRQLEQFAEDLGIRDRVLFAGWLPFDKMHEVYMRNDIQVVSSIAEAVPRCIVEGCAHGLPLVTTTAGGCADSLVNEVNALLVSSIDPQAIAEAIERVIIDGNLRRRLIAEGYAMARAFTFENAGLRFLNALRAIIP